MFLGIFVMIADPKAVKIGGEGNKYIGDLLSFANSGILAFTIFFLTGKGGNLHPMILMTQNLFFFCVYNFLIGVVMQGFSFISFDQINGAFGWYTSPSEIFTVMVIVAPVTGVL